MKGKEMLLIIEMREMFPFLRESVREIRSFPVNASDVSIISMMESVQGRSDVEILSCMQRMFPGASISDVHKYRKLLDAYLISNRNTNDPKIQAILDFHDELRNRIIKK